MPNLDTRSTTLWWSFFILILGKRSFGPSVFIVFLLFHDNIRLCHFHLEKFRSEESRREQTGSLEKNEQDSNLKEARAKNFLYSERTSVDIFVCLRASALPNVRPRKTVFLFTLKTIWVKSLSFHPVVTFVITSLPKMLPQDERFLISKTQRVSAKKI